MKGMLSTLVCVAMLWVPTSAFAVVSVRPCSAVAASTSTCLATPARSAPLEMMAAKAAKKPVKRAVKKVVKKVVKKAPPKKAAPKKVIAKKAPAKKAPAKKAPAKKAPV